jgi:hypothetical protein
MSSEDIVEIKVPDKERVAEIVDFIERELQPPSKLKWLIIFFGFGLMGGIGLGVLISWLR